MEEKTRRAHFEEIKRTIKEAQDYMLIGIDIAKDDHKACFMVSSGRIFDKCYRVENSRVGYEGLLKKIKDYQKVLSPEETIVGVETTGNYMLTLANFLEENGVFVVMVSSMVAKRNRDTLNLSWDKNDVKDAWNVVDCMKQGKILYYHYQENPYSDLKRVMNIYNRLSTERGLYKVRLQNNVLCITFPELTKIYPEVDELVPMTILERYPLPRYIRAVSKENFVQDIVQHSGPTARKHKLQEVYNLAQETIGSKEEAFSLEWETHFIVKRIKEIRKIQEEMLNSIKELSINCPEYELLQTIPGIGPILAGTIIAEIGDIDNYRSNRQILKLAGLDLARIQSGQFTGDVQISRRGKPALRSAAYQAALVAARNDSALRLKFLDLVQKKEAVKGEKRKLLVALACKILRIAFAVMKYKKPYQDNFSLLKNKVLDCAIVAG